MKKILLIISIFIAFVSQAQSSKWSDLFSYNNVVAIREDGDRLIAATENGVFYYNPSSEKKKKLWNMDSIAVTTLIFGLFLQINVCPLMCQNMKLFVMLKMFGK